MRRARYLWPLLFVWALLGASECSESSINRDINDIFGINTDSPTQVGGAILLGQTFGDEETQRAADMGSVLQDFRRADHEQKGDRLSSDAKYKESADEYRTALRWTGNERKHDPIHARLETELAVAMMSQGSIDRGSKAHFRETADHWAAAIRYRKRDPQYPKQAIGSLYFEQAWALNYAGDYGSACSAAKSGQQDGGGAIPKPLIDDLAAHGLTCR